MAGRKTNSRTKNSLRVDDSRRRITLGIFTHGNDGKSIEGNQQSSLALDLVNIMQELKAAIITSQALEEWFSTGDINNFLWDKFFF